MASRSTFREATHGVAWQRQLRDRHVGEAPDVSLDLKSAIVRPVSRRLAEQIILQYEWLGTMSSTRLHYGIFFGMHCAGVTCVAVGGGAVASPYVHRAFGIDAAHLAVLARGACVHWAPSGANSKLVAWTAKLVARDSAARLMIAYADTDAGEVGTIYQASNWTYIGRGGKTRQFVAPNGRVYDQKLGYDLRRSAGTLKTVRRRDQEQALMDAGWHLQSSNPKHRYVIVLDKRDTALVARVEAMRRPYPKRAGSLESEAALIHNAESGANPTPALHEEDHA